MNVSDPIADLLTRIRNALMVRHEYVVIPASRTKIAITSILKEEGFIAGYEVLKDSPQRSIKVQLKYTGKKEPVVTGLQRVSKPGLRLYVKKEEIPRVYGGMGIAILSTSQGVMTGRQAWRKGVGGEVLCHIW